jgi:hypothetical protein
MENDQKRLFEKTILENSKSILNIVEYTKDYISKLNYDDQGKTTNELFWLGIFIANQFCLCNATESRKRLHEINPQIYREIVEDSRLERIKNSVDLYEKAITYHRENFSPKDAFKSLLDMRNLRETAIKALSNGVMLANRKKDNEGKENIKNMVKSLLDAINIDIDLYNAVLTWGEDIRRLNTLANDSKQTQKARVLRPVRPITED